MTRGNTLLGLGSRPETLSRYLYALRGQQAPQQLGGATPAIPGFPGVNALPTTPPPSAAGGAGGTPSLPAPAAPSVSGPGMLAPQPAPTYAAGTQALGQTNPALSDLLRNAGSNLAVPQAIQGPTQPGALIPQANFAPLGSAKNPLVGDTRNGGFAFTDASGMDPTTQATIRARDPLLNAGKIWDPETGQYESFASGGVIPEHVVGVGMESGQPYQFGEEGTEAVVSNDMLERLMQVAGKVDLQQKDSDGKSRRFSFTLNGSPKKPKTNSYANGGTIGYSTDYDPKVFNPPNLADIVKRGYNTPGIPLLPQVGVLTGGGQSLIPSAQSFFGALPSERQAFSGFLQDEAGVVPDDVRDLMTRLAPKATGIRTPRFAA